MDFFFATVVPTKANLQKMNVGKSYHQSHGGCWQILVSKGKDNTGCEVVSWKCGLTRLHQQGVFILTFHFLLSFPPIQIVELVCFQFFSFKAFNDFSALSTKFYPYLIISLKIGFLVNNSNNYSSALGEHAQDPIQNVEFSVSPNGIDFPHCVYSGSRIQRN